MIRTEDLRLVPLSGGGGSSSGQLVVGGLHQAAASAPMPAFTPTATPTDAGLSQPPLVGDPLERLVAAWRDLMGQDRSDLFDQVEGALIHAAFDHAGKNQVKTAKLLGITRNMLRTQLKRHGLLAPVDDPLDDAAHVVAEKAA